MTSPPSSLITLRPSDTNWLYGCTAAPGYIVANAHRIPEQSTEYSEEGALAHRCAEAFVLGRKAPRGTPAEIKKHARAYADFVEQFKWEGPFGGFPQWGVEESVDRFYQPGRPAIVDFYAITSRKVTIVDLKYGQGVAVNAVHNKQLAIYARGVIQKLTLLAPDELEVEMHIWQPRIREGEKHSMWRTTWGELRQWTDDEIASLAEAILQGRAVQFLESDKTCRFCPARKCCDHKDEQRLKELPELIGGESFTPPVLDDAGLAVLIDRAKDIKKWLDDKTEYATERALAGQAVPDHKLVQGRGGHRVWIDDKAAAKVLRERFSPKVLYKKTLATPSQIDEAMSAEHMPEDYVQRVKGLMHKPEGKPTLVHVSDPRPEWGVPSLDELPDIEPVADTDWI